MLQCLQPTLSHPGQGGGRPRDVPGQDPHPSPLLQPSRPRSQDRHRDSLKPRTETNLVKKYPPFPHKNKNINALL